MYRVPNICSSVPFSKPAGTYCTRKKKKGFEQTVVYSKTGGLWCLKITKQHNFQAYVLDKIIEGINNTTMGTGSTSFKGEYFNSAHIHVMRMFLYD